MECYGMDLFDIEFSRDNKILVYSCGWGSEHVGFITFWNVAKQDWDDYWHEGKSTRTVTYEPGGNFLALGYYDGRMSLWSEAGGFVYLLAHAIPREQPWIPLDNDDKDPWPGTA